MPNTPPHEIFPLYVKDFEDKNEIRKALKFFESILESFEKGHGIEVEYSEVDASDMIGAFSRDIEKLSIVDKIKPSPYRLAGLVAFWIRKLKPIKRVTVGAERNPDVVKKFRRYRNELLALHSGMALSALNSSYPCSPQDIVEIIDDRLADLLYDLRYRAISPQAMTIIFQIVFKR